FRLLYPCAWMQILIIVISCVCGVRYVQSKAEVNIEQFSVNISKRMGITSLVILISLLIVLPILNKTFNNALLNIFAVFFRVGSLVFGGGHVVLPMIELELVPLGLLSSVEFFVGSGMA